MLLGIDIGTSATKCVAIDGGGAVVATGASPHPVDRPRIGWSEQPAPAWWDATVDAVGQVLSSGEVDASIECIGLSGQMHGSVLLDADALQRASAGAIDALRSPILWNDQRTGAECTLIEEAAGGGRALVESVGNAALTGFTLPKLLWVRANEPEIWRRTATVCLPKDFVRLQMTGTLATDVGDAAGTLLLDVARRTWNGTLAARLDLDPELLPPLLESCAAAGTLTAWAADRLGLAPGTPVVAGSGDNMVGAVGAGVVHPGQVLATLGTSGVVYAHSAEPRVDLADPDHPGRVHTMCAADGTAERPGAWAITGCMLAAAGSLHWARDTIAPQTGFDELIELAAQAPPGCEGLLFLPHLTGERCPHPDPAARGGWIGLTARHTRAHMIRAVIEGVTMCMEQVMRIIEGLPVTIDRVRLGGGGSRSALWRQIQADIYCKPVATLNAEEGPAYGAALMAGVGGGRWPSIAQACEETIRETEVREPDASRVAAYAAPREIFGTLYPALQATFKAMAEEAT